MTVKNIYLTIPCKDCNKTGVRDDPRHWLHGEACPFCRGRGFLPNEQGLHIIDLIKAYKLI